MKVLKSLSLDASDDLSNTGVASVTYDLMSEKYDGKVSVTVAKSDP